MYLRHLSILPHNECIFISNIHFILIVLTNSQWSLSCFLSPLGFIVILLIVAGQYQNEYVVFAH